LRTVRREIRNWRTIWRIGFLSTQNARLIRPIVSTVTIPGHAPLNNQREHSMIRGVGPYSTLITGSLFHASILRGHYGYFGLPHNWRALNAFRQNLLVIWFRCLRRRSQKARRLGWVRFKEMLERFPLPLPRITHPWATQTA
jgi:hypothetical protein